MSSFSRPVLSKLTGAGSMSFEEFLSVRVAEFF